MDNEILISLYDRLTGSAPQSVSAIKGSGSSRSYYRLQGAENLIGTIGTDRDENEAFFYLTDHFCKAGVNVPRIVAVSDDRMAYLQTDCGNRSLFDMLDRMDLLEKAMKELVKVQFKGAEGLDFSRCYPVEAFDRKAVMWDLNYFKYCFLKPSGVEFNEVDLEKDFERLASELAVKDDERQFMFRDFQSRNVIVNDSDEVTLIDYQGGRRGPFYYDVASFLWQARAGFDDHTRNHLIDVYLSELSDYVDISREKFVERLMDYVLLRQLQTLGAYGFRGLIEHKAHFIKSIPQAIANLRKISFPTEKYPSLARALADLVNRYDYWPTESSGLVVRVGSFSFMKGIPTDMTGNGGGFVFDCRGLPNPGRYEQYKKLTGRDCEVIEFLEKEPDVERFVKDAADMVSISVETYLRRGFTSLMVNFGCTGGQHRSVYCAERLAHFINERFNVEVELCHREQNIKERLKKK